jgi:hypothetical protein
MSRVFVSKNVCGQFEKYRQLKKHEILAPSFDKLRMRLRVINEFILMVSLSRFGGLTVRPWATPFFSRLI